MLQGPTIWNKSETPFPITKFHKNLYIAYEEKYSKTISDTRLMQSHMYIAYDQLTWLELKNNNELSVWCL